MAHFVNFIVFMIMWSLGCYFLSDIANPWQLMSGAVLGLVATSFADLAEQIYRFRGNNITDID